MAQDPLFILIILACLAVMVVLMLGLGGFAKGSGWAQKNSNKLMRYRIGAQFVAVLLIVAYVLLRQNGGE
ncbi:twin transmembrane helix small protein [uncultured Tateyamaria sp.]|uniref:twin transmembrane helix small protein n=1 Tax=Tateyamaria sp. TaxID=1929288 RepID=UPI0026352A2F|nr:twin transmembrane helix small protein [uncultured Tateyamaria sp.]